MTPEAMPQSALFFCGLPQMALLLLLVQTRIRKRRRLARLLQQRKQLELMMRAASSVIAASMSVEADEASGEPRRKIERAWSRWRGSTLAGYLFQGDDITFRSNFRMSRETFGKLINLLKGSSIDADVADVHALRQRGSRRAGKRGGQTTAYCRAMTNPPTIEFKVGACLYAMGQGGCLKISADVASVGRQTLRDYLVQFNEAIMQKIRPIYMPCTPFSVEERASVQANFASRRNMGGVTLACDGSHIPFHPLVKSTAIDYRNYKGWYSILSVAFVDSYYRFFDLDVGYPGRAGDNTVLRSNWLMQAIAHDKDKWLGPGGVILGDCGASDGDQFFLNPYHNAATPDACWFNFCHSSTRFYVEETFGRWKNRWRFLMHPLNVDHKLTTQLIYISAILHNMCTAHARDGLIVAEASTEQAWSEFLDRYAAQQCFACRARQVKHCVHQSIHRNGAAQQAQARKAPSVLRDELCKQLWQDLLSGRVGGVGKITEDDLHLASAEGDAVQATVKEMEARCGPSTTQKAKRSPY